MCRPTASGLGFAIAGGAPAPFDRMIWLDPPRPRQPGRRRLLAVVEPLESSERGRDAAEIALSALRDAFRGAAGRPLAVALGEAFAAANAAVRDENRLRPGEGHARRLGVGATAIALEGRQLVLAQVPPSQAILVQEGRVYAFPDLASWDGRYLPPGDRVEPEPEPLGCRECANPDLFRTLAAPDDLIVLCGSVLPSCLARDGLIEPAESDDRPTFADLLRAGDPDVVVDRLGGIVEANGLDDAHVACFTVGRLHTLDPALAREAVARLALAWGVVPPPSRRAGRSAAPRGAAAPRGHASHRHGRVPAGPAPSAGRRRRAYARIGVALDDDESEPDRASPDCSNPANAGDPDRVAPARPRPRPIGGETGVVSEHRPLAVSDGPIGVLAVPAEPVVHAAPPTRPERQSAGAVPPDARPRFDDMMAGGSHRRRTRAFDALHFQPAEPVLPVVAGPIWPDRRAGRLVATVAPGALGLERYRARGAVGLPGGWRLSLPRLPGVEGSGARRSLAAVVLLVLVAGMAGAFGAGPMAGAADRVGVSTLAARVRLPAWTGLSDRASDLNAALAEVDDHLDRASTLADPALADQELALAEAALTEAIAAGAAGDALAARQSALAALRDRLAGVGLLAAPLRLGALPAPAAAHATLLLGGDGLYVATDDLFHFDERGLELSRLAGSGDQLGTATLGTPRGAAWEDGHLVLTDGVALFSRDAAGIWSARPLASPADGVAAWPAAPCGAFGGNFYLLDVAAGRILKFAAEDLSAPPRDWADGASAEDLRTARDMVVDGRIHVLLADGRILSFYRGILEETFVLPPELTVADPIALVSAADGRAFYVLDRGDGASHGRLFRIDRLSGTVQELVFDSGADPERDLLAAARDIAVDERAGHVYLLTDDALWRVDLPRLSRPDA